MRPRLLRLSGGWGAPHICYQGGWGAQCSHDQRSKVCHATTAFVIQQTHRESVLALEHEARAEEGRDHQAFVEAFGVAIWSYLLETCGALMYPLQLLTSIIPLGTILGMSATAQLWAVVNGGLMPVASMPSVLQIPAPLTGVKCQCHSSHQAVPTPRSEEEETAELNDTPNQ